MNFIFVFVTEPNWTGSDVSQLQHKYHSRTIHHTADDQITALTCSRSHQKRATCDSPVRVHLSDQRQLGPRLRRRPPAPDSNKRRERVS